MRNQIKKTASFFNTWSKVEREGIAVSSRKAFYSKEHFPKFLGALMISGSFAGYCAMDRLHKNRVEVSAKVV